MIPYSPEWEMDALMNLTARCPICHEPVTTRSKFLDEEEAHIAAKMDVDAYMAHIEQHVRGVAA